MSYQHVIIAGVNKCGTTSVFRYLADHPEVCASSIKEVRFFVQESYDSSDSSHDEYLSCFSHCKNKRVLLEASPSYFSWGEKVANRIVRLIPTVRIIVFLRNPVDRLYSYYRSALVYDNYANALLSDVSFSEFVDIALQADQDCEETDVQRVEFRRALHQGRYAAHMETFGSQFLREQICYVFFEDFADNPHRVMNDICTFIDVDTQFFDEYDFRVENKTRSFRSIKLQKLGFSVNMRFEKILNRNPELRRMAQSLYRWANERRDQAGVRIDSETHRKLLDFYGDENVRLRQLLANNYRRTEFPSWL